MTDRLAPDEVIYLERLEEGLARLRQDLDLLPQILHRRRLGGRSGGTGRTGRTWQTEVEALLEALLESIEGDQRAPVQALVILGYHRDGDSEPELRAYGAGWRDREEACNAAGAVYERLYLGSDPAVADG